MPETKTSAKRSTGRKTSATVWTDEERAAMQEHAKEMKAARKRKGKADGEADVLAKIAEMPDSDRQMAERIHAIVKESAPELSPRTWYGMPAYATEAGKVVCFFTPASKFNERYASFGFNAEAHLDEGSMWPTAWALTKLTPADEKKIGELVKQAVS
jgi:uncharacterized protein YdhG (YjbR/CyaY superfamily)